MEKNITVNNNKRTFTVSNTTADMLALLKDFLVIQERAIAMYNDKTGGENIINATAEVYHLMQEALTANICDTLTNSQVTEL